MIEPVIPLYKRPDADKYFISPADTVRQALKKLNLNGKKVLLVVDECHRLLGTLSDGDIRAFILSGRSLLSRVKSMYHSSPLTLEQQSYTLEKARQVFLENTIDLIPILDQKSRVIEFITWKQAFAQEENPQKISGKKKLSIPVVIMAGGKGSRLDPFTRIFPKPLLPIGDKPVIEEIIDGFRACGANEFIISLNFKAAMIQAFFDNIDHDYHLTFVREKDFLGTAGSLLLVEKMVPETFIVSNCDIIVKADFNDILEFHHNQGAMMTIVSSIQHFRIPYGVIYFKKGGRVTGIKEKPEFTFPINTGVYMINREVISLIPHTGAFDMPSLIQRLIDKKHKVVLYPINEGDYIDIGQWDEFKKALVTMGFGPETEKQ